MLVYPSNPKNDGFVSDFEEPLNFCMDKFDTMELQKKNGYTRFVECSHFSQPVRVVEQKKSFNKFLRRILKIIVIKQILVMF